MARRVPTCRLRARAEARSTNLRSRIGRLSNPERSTPCPASKRRSRCSVRCRSCSQRARQAPAPRGGRCRGRPQASGRGGRPAVGLRPAAARPARCAGCGRRRRVHRRRQVDAGELDWSASGSPRAACCVQPPARRSWCTTPTTPNGSCGTDCCPISSAPTTIPTTSARCRWCRPAASPRVSPSSMRPTSTRSRPATGELATQLLAAADLWLFVTSAARYADQVPWDYLRQAAERSTSLAVVLDRTPPDAVVEVRGHLARMMTSRGLSDSPLFTVPESGTDHEGLLTRDVVVPVLSVAARHRRRPRNALGRHEADSRRRDPARGLPVARHRRCPGGAERAPLASSMGPAADVYDQALTARVQRESPTVRCSAASCSARGAISTSPATWPALFERRRFRRRVADGIASRNSPWSHQLAQAAERGGACTRRRSRPRARPRKSHASGSSPTQVGSCSPRPVASIGRRTIFGRGSSGWSPTGGRSSTTAIQREAVGNRKLGAIAQHQLEGLTAVLAGVVLDDLSRLGVTARGGPRSNRSSAPSRSAHGRHARGSSILTAIASVLEVEQQRFLDLLDSPETVQAAHDTLREAARRADYARHTDALDEKTS